MLILVLAALVVAAPTTPNVLPARRCTPPGCSPRALEAAPTVHAPVGTVEGITDPATPSVDRFLGIPFAQPPLGPLRFSPPQKLESLPSSPFDASHPPASCMQFLFEKTIYTQDILEFNLQGLNDTSAAVSEDCLTLDVYTPTPGESSPTDQKLPVIVFLYGGGFAMGGADIPYQIPAKWVQRTQKHIVVVPNYRLNIFGFPHAAGMQGESQNLGLLDQRLAIEWVRDNIAAFGGDPQRIALWGQSAGAVSAGFYQYAWDEDPIIDAVMMDSGSEFLGAAVQATQDVKFSNFTTVAKGVGCGELGPVEELECMRGKDAKAIENVIQTHNQKMKPPLLIFTPVVDGVTVFDDYAVRGQQGRMAKVPAIIGTNVNDGSAFVPVGANGGGGNQTLANAVGLLFFDCPALKSDVTRIAAGAPVYRYLYAGNFTNISPKPFLGAYHEAELPLLFGTFEDFRGGATEQERETSVAMQDSWLALASSGVAGMEEVGWPRYTGLGGEVREFGGPSVVRDISTSAMDATCPAFFQP
ncbi:acetylcholinesterase [Podospora conica]|nr:acetylcholinesterase [Schizothecium conicum]